MIDGLIDAEHAGVSYAAVAEAVIAGLQRIVERDMVATHGRITGGAFVTVALGKLGGREMTASSDLDLVFIYDHDKGAGVSDGAKPLPASVYFARFSQRLIAALTASTAAGQLYDVDMRLRPSGNQGPVAVSLESFELYHAGHAWTWEHLALTRARVLVGAGRVARQNRARDPRHIHGEFGRSGGDPSRRARDARQTGVAISWPRSLGCEVCVRRTRRYRIHRAKLRTDRRARQDASVLAQNTVQALDKLKRAGVIAADDAVTLAAAARLQQALLQVLRIALDGPFEARSAPLALKTLLARAGRCAGFSYA